MEDLVFQSSDVRKEYVDYVCETCLSQNQALHHLDLEAQELLTILSIEKYLDSVNLSRLNITEAVKTATPRREQDDTVVLSDSSVDTETECESLRFNIKSTKYVQNTNNVKNTENRESCTSSHPPLSVYYNQSTETPLASSRCNTMPENVITSKLKSSKKDNAFTNCRKITIKPAKLCATDDKKCKDVCAKSSVKPSITHKTIYLVDPRHPSDAITKVKVKEQQTKTIAYLSLGPNENTADVILPELTGVEKKTVHKLHKDLSNRSRARSKTIPKIEVNLEKRAFPNILKPKSTEPKKVSWFPVTKPKVNVVTKNLVQELYEMLNVNKPGLVKTQKNSTPKKRVRDSLESKLFNSKKVECTSSEAVTPILKKKVEIEPELHEIVDLVSDTEEITYHIQDKTQARIILDTVKFPTINPVPNCFENSGKTPETLSNLVLHQLVKRFYSDFKTNLEKTNTETKLNPNIAPDSIKHINIGIETTPGAADKIENNPAESHTKITHMSEYTLDTECNTVKSLVPLDFENPLLSYSLLPVLLQPEPDNADLTSPNAVTPSAVAVEPNKIEVFNYLYQPNTLRHFCCIALNIIPENHVGNVRRTSDETPSSIPISATNIVSNTLPNRKLKKVNKNPLKFAKIKPKPTVKTRNDHTILSKTLTTKTVNKSELKSIASGTRSKTLKDKPVVTVPKTTPRILKTRLVRSSKKVNDETRKLIYCLVVPPPKTSSDNATPILVDTESETTEKVIEGGTLLPTTHIINKKVLDDVVIQSKKKKDCKKILQPITVQSSPQDNNINTIFVEQIPDELLDISEQNKIGMNNVITELYSPFNKTIYRTFRKVDKMLPKSDNAMLSTDTRIPVIRKIKQMKTSDTNYVKMQQEVTNTIPVCYGAQMMQFNENTTIKSNAIDSLTSSVESESYNPATNLRIYLNADTTDLSPEKLSSQDINYNINDLYVGYANDSSDFLPSFYCTENMPDSEYFQAGNTLEQKELLVTKNLNLHQPHVFDDVDTIDATINEGTREVSLDKKTAKSNMLPLVVRRITAEGLTKPDMYDEMNQCLESIQDQESHILERPKRRPRKVYLSGSKFKRIIIVAEESKHILRDHGYCALYAFKRITRARVIPKQNLVMNHIGSTSWIDRAQQMTNSDDHIKIPQQNLEINHTVSDSRMSLAQQMTASEDHIKNLIQNIVDSFDDEYSNEIDEQFNLVESMEAVREDSNEEHFNVFNEQTNEMVPNGTNIDISMHVDHPVIDITNSLSIDVKVEVCDADEYHGNSDWTNKNEMYPRWDIEKDPNMKVEGSDTASATSTYTDDISLIRNYFREKRDSDTDSAYSDDVGIPPGYIRDDSLHGYTDYELQPIENTGRVINEIDDNPIIEFSTAVYESELENAPVYSTGNTVINEPSDTNFNSDNDSRNTTPSLLEPRYYTDWEDTTYAHFFALEEPKERKKANSKTIDSSTKSGPDKKRYPQRRKRKRSNINYSVIDKKKTRRVSKSTKREEIYNQERDINEKNYKSKLSKLLQPIVLVDKLDAEKLIKRKTKDINTSEETDNHDQSVEDVNLQSSEYDVPKGNAEKIENVDAAIDQKRSIKDKTGIMLTRYRGKRMKVKPREPKSLVNSNEIELLDTEENTGIRSIQTKVLEETDKLTDELDKSLENVSLQQRRFHELVKKRLLLDGELEELREKTRNSQDFINAAYKCKKCVRVLFSKLHYMKHISKFHKSKTASIVCQICECKFEKKFNWKKHYARHSVCFVCVICDSGEYLYLKELHEHIKTDHPEAYTNSKNISKLKWKSRNTNRMSYGCGRCKKTYGRIVWLIRHLNTVHNQDVDERAGTERIKLLKSKLITIKGSNIDKDNYAEKKTCTVEKQLNPTDKDLNSTNNGHNATGDRLSTTENIILSENSVSSNLKRYRCGYCNKSYDLRRWLFKHLKIKHNEDVSEWDNTDKIELLVSKKLVIIEDSITNKDELAAKVTSTTENEQNTTDNQITKENDLNSTESYLNTTENQSRLSENYLNSTENSILLPGNSLNTTENVFSLSESRSSTSENELNATEKDNCNGHRFDATESNFNFCDEDSDPSDIELDSPEINSIFNRVNSTAKNNLVCIDDSMIVMERSVDITANEFSPQKDKSITNNPGYVLLNNEEHSGISMDDQSNLGKDLSPIETIDLTEHDIGSMEFTILGLLPTNTDQDYATITKNNVVVMQSDFNLPENVVNLSECNISETDCVSLTENTFGLVESNLSTRENNMICYNLMESNLSPEESYLSVSENDITHLEFGNNTTDI